MNPDSLATVAQDAAAMAPDAMANPDITLFGLLLKADLVVKSVLLIMVFMSLVSWAIVIDQSVRLRQARREVTKFARLVLQSTSMQAWVNMVRGAPATKGPKAIASLVLGSGLSEWMESDRSALAREDYSTRRDRTERAMKLTLSEQMREFEGRLPFLATVGSTAPFIGLFGTVWGIMNSFLAIAHSNDTSLAVVAPGIAEALFATAVGLFAAIPAVIAYNKLVDSQRKLNQEMSIAIGRASMRMAKQAPPAHGASQGAATTSAAAE
jgi:biopolymer transport protein TolQ